MHELIGSGEIGRHDADHRHVHTGNANAAAEDSAIGGKFLLPQFMIEDDDRIAANDAIVVDADGAPEHRLHPEHVEEIAADSHAELTLRGLVGGVGKARNDQPEGGQAAKAAVAIADLFVIRIGQGRGVGRRESRFRRHGGHVDDLARTWGGQRSKDECVRKAEHRRVGPDADRDRGHRDQREARILPQHPDAVREVLPESANHHSALNASTGLMVAARRAGK